MPGDSPRGVERAIERARAERSAGRAWRAKEILRGNLGARPYDRALYRAYGELQLELGEAMEAGRYLLLAGSDEAAHAEPVELYLRRCGREAPGLHATFPSSARGLPLEQYPERVRRIFEDSGWTPPPRVDAPPEGLDGAASRARDLVVVAGTLFVVASLIVGALRILVWTWAALTSSC